MGQIESEERLTNELPSALGEGMASALAGRPPAVFLDYDGTLTPIVAHADQAILADATRQAIERLAQVCPVAIVSGRDRADVEARVGLGGLYYAGSHGFDITGPAGFARQRGEEYRPVLAEAASQMERGLESIEGAWVERKRYAVAVHYRQVSEQSIPALRNAVEDVASHSSSLRMTGGKKIYELRPALDWDKGKAVLWLLEVTGLGDEAVPVYVGDDETDEDVFRAFQGRVGIGVVVGDEARLTHAQFALPDPDQVAVFLGHLADLAEH